MTIAFGDNLDWTHSQLVKRECTVSQTEDGVPLTVENLNKHTPDY